MQTWGMHRARLSHEHRPCGQNLSPTWVPLRVGSANLAGVGRRLILCRATVVTLRVRVLHVALLGVRVHIIRNRDSGTGRATALARAEAVCKGCARQVDSAALGIRAQDLAGATIVDEETGRGKVPSCR